MLPRPRSNVTSSGEAAAKTSHGSINTTSATKATDHDYSKNYRSLDDPVGLRILIQGSTTSKSIVVVKPVYRLIQQRQPPRSTRPTHRNTAVAKVVLYEESSFLKACCLCRKKLTSQMDVYMYRGDQGFCSVDCRCRQIMIDEIKEIEASTKEVLASARRCPPNVVPPVITVTSQQQRVPTVA